MSSPARFNQQLSAWWKQNKRTLPWKNQVDPYKIWVSEIILQQTRVAQGTPYYLRFIETFPDITTLANATLDEVMKAWQGLGYYSRARNMHISAKLIVEQHHSVFPSDYPSLLNLKGVGAYTAAAIASFAFELPCAVVDGNVIRFVTRLLGITKPVSTKAVSKEINTFVSEAIQLAIPSEFNQAIMDFGAIICVPNKPNCGHCPFSEDCFAYRNELISSIPHMKIKPIRQVRYFHYYHLIDLEGKTIITQREKDDIWKNLYEFPMIETLTEQSPSDNEVTQLIDGLLADIKYYKISVKATSFKQNLTHRVIIANIYKISFNQVFNEIKRPYCLVDSQKVSNFAFPKLINTYLTDKK